MLIQDDVRRFEANFADLDVFRHVKSNLLGTTGNALDPLSLAHWPTDADSWSTAKVRHVPKIDPCLQNKGTTG